MRLGPPARPSRVADLLNPAGVLLPAANVIMQLASPAVGYGVLESPVDSGNVYKHPLKRSRTTGYYLAAATVGTDADRALVRKEIDKVHALIRSTPSSPLPYNAFDPALQVRDDMWPSDRVAFDEYWKRSLEQLRIDPPVREHLYGVAAALFLPTPFRQLLGPMNLFATTGFLPPEFRTHMRLPWTSGQQRRFELLLTTLRIADRVVPRDVWLWWYGLYLRSMRTRARLGWRVI